MQKHLFTVFFILSIFSIQAQNTIDPNNLSNLNVDELTDQQIGQFLKQVEENGYTEDQLLVLAKARGMSDLQVQKLKNRIEEYRQTQSGKTSDPSDINQLREMPDISKRKSGFDPFLAITPKDTLKDKEDLEIFGLSFFRNDKLTFEPNLNVPTPKDYTLGPGDQIIIDIWGASEQNYQLMISTEGSIRIPNLGPIYLNGLTVERAAQRIKYRLKSIYSTLGSQTFAEVSVGQIRTITVSVIGDVVLPGSFNVTSFTSVFNLLYLAGGPTETGSLRKIEVYREGEKIATQDGYAYLASGDPKPISLQEADIILVRPYVNRVKIRGEIKRPAIYETLPGENLEQLIRFVGGFTENAYDDVISIRRNKGSFKEIVSVSNDDFSSVELMNGDDIEVTPISNIYKSRVTIEGAVVQPGEYAYSDGLKLSQVIQQANGLRGDAFLQRAVILRQNEDFSLTTLSIDLRDVISGDTDVDLNNEDLITIKSIYDLKEDYTVRIEGEVLKPGTYPFSRVQKVEDLIYLAGGFKESAAKSFVEIARRIDPDSVTDVNNTAEIFNFPISSDLSLSSKASTFNLQPFDLVVIRRSPFFEDQIMITIEGEVEYPGKYALQRKDEKISDVIERAGGLTNYAYAKGATLIRRTEYYALEDEATTEAARIRREELKSILERDTLIDKSQANFKRQEAIGIRLEEIIKNPRSEFDLVLREGDVISIPKELQTVRVRGEVLYPSNVRFDKAVGFKNYVGRAGGFTDEARVKKAYVIYANGSAERTKSFLWFKNFPKIEPGAEVIIPKKPERQPLSAQAWIALASSTATLALVIQQLVN